MKKALTLLFFLSILSPSNAHHTKKPDHTFSFLKSCDHLIHGIGLGYLSYQCLRFALDMDKEHYLITDCAALVAFICAVDFGLHSITNLDKAVSSHHS